MQPVNVLATLDRRMRWPLVLVLGLLWAGLTWLSFQSMDVGEEEVDSSVLARYYDRDLRLLDAASRSGAYGRWLAGDDDRESLYRDCLEALERGHAAALGDDGPQLTRYLKHQLGESTEEPDDDPDYLKEMHDWLLSGAGNAWDFELFLLATDDDEVAAFYQRQNDRLMTRVIALNLLTDGLSLLGFVCLLLMFVRWRAQAIPRPHRLTAQWSPRVVLGCFFTVFLLQQPWSLIIGMQYDAVSMVLPEWLAYIGYDLIFRLFDAGLLVLLFLGSPFIAYRFFGQGKGVAWVPLLAMVGLQSLLEMGMFYSAPLTPADPTDFMEVADPDAPYLFSLLLSAVVIAPICEEVVFRGFLFHGLRHKLGNLGAGLLSTGLFAFAHAQYDIWGLLSVALTGAGAAYLTLRTGSLTSAIAYHALLNLIACGSVYYQYQMPL